MDYDLTPFLDNDDYSKIKDINDHLDIIMDDLFFGKKLSFLDVLHDIKYLENIKGKYMQLIFKQRSMLKEDATLLSKSAGKSFIISWVSIMGAYFVPFLAVPSIFAFAKGMKYYTAYRVISNKDVIDEYLSSFDDLQRRINNYNDVLKEKYLNMIDEDIAYLYLMNIFAGRHFKVDDNNMSIIINTLKKELNDNDDDLINLINKAINKITYKEECKDKTLLMKK